VDQFKLEATHPADWQPCTPCAHKKSARNTVSRRVAERLRVRNGVLSRGLSSRSCDTAAKVDSAGSLSTLVLARFPGDEFTVFTVSAFAILKPQFRRVSRSSFLNSFDFIHSSPHPAVLAAADGLAIQLVALAPPSKQLNPHPQSSERRTSLQVALRLAAKVPRQIL